LPPVIDPGSVDVGRRCAQVLTEVVMRDADEMPESRRVYCCEVEITELSSGSSHRVPLSFHTAIALVPAARRPRRARTAKASTPTSEQRLQVPPVAPPKEFMRFVDGSVVVEASTWEEFRARLRDQYPDDRFERRLHIQRDREAEVRREEAINALIRFFAEAAFQKLLKEQRESSGTQRSI
jgi:hypothetical protein